MRGAGVARGGSGLWRGSGGGDMSRGAVGVDLVRFSNEFGNGAQAPQGPIDYGIGASGLAEQGVVGLRVFADIFQDLQGVGLLDMCGAILAVEPCNQEDPVIGILHPT